MRGGLYLVDDNDGLKKILSKLNVDTNVLEFFSNDNSATPINAHSISVVNLENTEPSIDDELDDADGLFNTRYSRVGDEIKPHSSDNEGCEADHSEDDSDNEGCEVILFLSNIDMLVFIVYNPKRNQAENDMREVIPPSPSYLSQTVANPSQLSSQFTTNPSSLLSQSIANPSPLQSQSTTNPSPLASQSKTNPSTMPCPSSNLASWWPRPSISPRLTKLQIRSTSK